MFSKKSRRRIAVMLVLVLALVVPVSVGLAQGSLGNPGVLAPNSHPYGGTYADWSVRWMQWLYPIPYSTNPLFDLKGDFCGVGQSGPVWFLVGTGFGEAATRSCTIPVGKAILFPIINVNNDYPCPYEGFEPSPGQTLEDFLTNGNSEWWGAKDYMDAVTALNVEVDGVSLQNLFNYRATSPMFIFTGDTSLKKWDPCVTGTPQKGVSDGFWIMLAPLSAGPHTIHFSAEGPWSVNVTYNLTVKR